MLVKSTPFKPQNPLPNFSHQGTRAQSSTKVFYFRIKQLIILCPLVPLRLCGKNNVKS